MTTFYSTTKYIESLGYPNAQISPAKNSSLIDDARIVIFTLHFFRQKFGHLSKPLLSRRVPGKINF
ncbi:MAG: hypothetical protein AAB447_01190 [Patescibacteria group bacterium]